MSIYSQIRANTVKTYVVMAMFIALITGIGVLMGIVYEDPLPFFYGALLFALINTIGGYWFSDSIVLSSVSAHPADKQRYFDFYTVTENLCIASGMVMPRLYVIDDPTPNAFATGRNEKHAVVCATTGLLAKLDRAEIEGVVAHELSHIKNRDILVMTIAAVLAGTLATLADWFLRFGLRSGGGSSRKKNPIALVILVIALILAPIAATLIQLTISRRREYLADASGALLTRYPEGLARALEKISAEPRGIQSAPVGSSHLWIANPYGKRGKIDSFLEGMFATHPPVEERIAVLRKM